MVNLLFPLTTVASLALLSFSFTLPVALIGSLNKDALMPAFRNPVRSMFFNILPDYMQGRARAISVAIVLPLALMTCGIILVLMQRLENPAYFLVPGIMAAGMYLLFNTKMNRAYVGTLIDTLKERLFLPDRRMYAALNGCNDEVRDEITTGVNHADPEVAVSFAKVLAASFPRQAPAVILKRARTAGTETTDRLMALLEPLDTAAFADELRALAGKGDAHLKSTILRLLLDSGSPEAEAAGLLESPNPRLRATAIHAGLQHPELQTVINSIVPAWEALLEAGTDSRLAAMDIISDLPLLPAAEKQILLGRYRAAFLELLADETADLKIRALHGLGRWEEALSEDVLALLRQLMDSENPAIRDAVTKCLHTVPGTQREVLLLQAIGDGHKRVREAGLEVLRTAVDDCENLALAWISGNRGSLRAQQTLLHMLLESALPKSTFEKIARNKLDEARRLQNALHFLQGERSVDETTSHAVLRYSLKEQLDQYLELVLLALEPLYETGLIGIIRAGIGSGDIRHIANAREALENLDDREPVAGLAEILRQSVNDEYTRDGSEFRDPADVIDWCAGHPDEWLRACGSRALQVETQGYARA
jgi:hypothetical protein